MIHKISDFCLKIDGVKKTSDRLYNLKYNNPKTPERDQQIQELIDDIQATCLLIANDKQPYDNTIKNDNFDSNGLPKDFTDKFRIEDEGGV